MAIDVKVLDKLRNSKKELVGYIIVDANGKQMQVNKEALKQAVKSGAINVINMTLTSDGRLVGRADKKVNDKRLRSVSIRVLEIYTNGRNIVGALVDESALIAKQGGNAVNIVGLNPGINFDDGKLTMEKMRRGWYSNVKIEGNKPVGEFKKRSFKAVRNRMLKTLTLNNVDISKLEVLVSKTDTRGEYVLTLDNEIMEHPVLSNIVKLLMCDAMITAKLDISGVADQAVMVNNKTIAEVRKAAKQVFKPVVNKTK